MDYLVLLDVVDRGVPNKEKVPIRVNRPIDLGNFWLGIGLRQSDNQIYPINDNMMWLGGGFVMPGDWLFVYTGKGLPKTTELPNQPNRIFSMHWGRDSTLFSSAEIFPYLIHGSIGLAPSHNLSSNSLGSILTNAGEIE